MGKTICDLVLDNPDMDLVGMVERPEYQPRVAPVDCVVSDDFESVVDTCPENLVVIDFSNPQNSLHTAEVCAKEGISLVIGTTGFSQEEQAELASYARKTRLFWSPNMSVGVSVLQKILPLLVKDLGRRTPRAALPCALASAWQRPGAGISQRCAQAAVTASLAQGPRKR